MMFQGIALIKDALERLKFKVVNNSSYERKSTKYAK